MLFKSIYYIRHYFNSIDLFSKYILFFIVTTLLYFFLSSFVILFSLLCNTGSANLITKVYFPRIIIPASASLAGLLDFFISMLVLGVLMIYYQSLPGVGLLLFPVLAALTFLCAVGVGFWFSALNVQYLSEAS